MKKSFVILIIMLCCLSGCAVKKVKDVSYLSENPQSPKLNIFYSKHSKTPQPVLIFIHGGNWNTGNKNTYGMMARNFARKGIIMVVPDYTLSPKADYNQMAQEVAAAIRWTQKNIAQYGGDPKQLFVTGHSAGGHLGALAVLNPKYGIDPKTISGIILNDAAGLDMKNYLEHYPPTSEHDYMSTWSTDPSLWRDASPIYFLNAESPRFMVYVGKKTYASIKEGNDRFLNELHRFQPNVTPIYVNKSHIPMVLQYFSRCSKRFGEVEGFIGSRK
jgi:arylformamidase